MFFVAVVLAIIAIFWFNHKGNQDRQANRISPSILLCGVLAVAGIILVQAFPVLFFGK
jgi:hypothetical protein